MQPFFLRFYRPLPAPVPLDLETLRSDGTPIDPRRTSLQFATQIDGGYGAMSAGFEAEFATDTGTKRTAWLDRAVECPPLGHMVVSTASGGEVWAGRRNTPTYTAGRFREVAGAGYGTQALDDQAILNPPSISTTSQGIIRYALGSLLPPVPIGTITQFVDPGVPHSTDEYADRTPLDLVKALSSEGGSANVLFDLTLYEGRVANFLPRLAPPQPDYWIPFDSTVKLTEDDTQLYDTIKLTYTTPTQPDGTAGVATYLMQTNAQFYSTYGFHRSKVVPGGTMTLAGASQWAATWLALHGQPWISCTVTRPPDRGIELWAGMAERPAFYARSGEWCQVGNEGPFLVISTSYVAHSDTFTMTLSQPSGGFLAALSNVMATSTAVRRGLNPNTGSQAA